MLSRISKPMSAMMVCSACRVSCRVRRHGRGAAYQVSTMPQAKRVSTASDEGTTWRPVEPFCFEGLPKNPISGTGRR